MDGGDNFANLFKKFRLKAEFATLREFGDFLAKEGIFYEDSIFSHWQRGDRIPKDRRVLIKILSLFVKKGAVSSVDEINSFLASTGQGYITSEEKILFEDIFLKKNLKESKVSNESLLDQIQDQDNFHDYFDEQVDIAYEKIYEGYPYMVYENMSKLLGLIYKLKLENQKNFNNLISKINWVKSRCLSDITKPENFKNSYGKVLLSLNYAKEKKTTEIGQNYWMVLAIKRLEIVTRKKIITTEAEVKDCLELGEVSMQNIPKNHFGERLVGILELAKVALVLNNEDLFERHIETAFKFVSQLTSRQKYLQILAMDTMARGKIHFNKISEGLRIIEIAKKNINKKYRAINLFLKNTEHQALINMKDSISILLAKKLQLQIGIEASILGNPYQKLRLKRKQLFGL